MEYLNWISDHPILTVILFMIVFGCIAQAFSGFR